MERKFKDIEVNYEDGLFDHFTETTLTAVIDYLKENDIINEVEAIKIFLK